MTLSLSRPSTSTLGRATRRRPAGPARYLAVWRQRRALARLDDKMLKDIGISRAEATREAQRPIWDLPI